jgi:chromosome partitioning protein
LAVINQKGGVGKTTTAVNHGAALARLGRTVLLIDLDPQANLTLHLDCRPAPGGTMTDVLLRDRPLAELIVDTSTPGLSVVPADTALASVEQALADRIGREMVLRDALNRLEGERRFDFVLMDCPPSLGVLSANALVATHEVLIPLQTEYFALQGMAKLLEVIELVRRRLNPGLAVCSVLPCMVDLRTNLASEVLDEIRSYFGPVVAATVIRANVKLAEAPSFGRTIFEHAPDSHGAADHEAFAREFLAGAAHAASPPAASASPANGAEPRELESAG